MLWPSLVTEGLLVRDWSVQLYQSLRLGRCVSLTSSECKIWQGSQRTKRRVLLERDICEMRKQWSDLGKRDLQGKHEEENDRGSWSIK